MQAINIFRTILSTDGLGDFLTDAIHDGGKVQSLTVRPIRDGLVGEALEYNLTDLPDVVAKIEGALAEI